MFSLSAFQSKGHNQKLFTYETFKKMSPSFQTLRDEFKNVLGKVELECQDD